nr:MAG TPA: hypothetical protein [Caudoviricetes sp.]
MSAELIIVLYILQTVLGTIAWRKVRRIKKTVNRFT